MRIQGTDTSNHSGDRNAFTLIEILLVLALLTVISSVAFPSIARWQRTLELDRAAQQVCNFLQNARLLAIDNALPVHVEVDFDDQLLRCQQPWNVAQGDDDGFEEICKLDEGFELQFQVRDFGEQLRCDSHLVFHADGTAVNGVIAIKETLSGDVRILKTSRLTGSVRVVQ